MNTKPLARRRSQIYTCIALAIAGLTISFTAEADSLGFADLGTTTGDGSNTSDLNTATSFVFGNLTSTVGSGVFSGLPTQTFGSVSFNLTDPTSLSFSSSEFGTYTSTSISVASNVAGFLSMDTTGTWTPGTFSGFSGLTGSLPAAMTITLTQSPPVDGTIGGGGSFSFTSPLIIPEPTTSWLLGISLAALAGIAYWRRKPDHDPDAITGGSI